MSTEPNPNVTPSSVSESHPANSQPTVKNAAPRRRMAARQAIAQQELAEAILAVKNALAREAKAKRKVEREARRLRAKTGHDCVAGLVARLDPSVREMVLGNLLGVAKAEEAANVQEWMATLAPTK